MAALLPPLPTGLEIPRPRWPPRPRLRATPASPGGLVEGEVVVAVEEDAGGGDLKKALRGYGEALRAATDEKEVLSGRAAALAGELREARATARRVSAEFESFRREVEEERLSLSRDVRAEVAESLLPIWESFGMRAGENQVEAKTAGEEEIDRSYRSIYRHFGEVLSSLGFIDREDDRPTTIRDNVEAGFFSVLWTPQRWWTR
ncbi:unnamed protein product [Spirodela intermedia]|uniref:Uncharacterized protein n=1 Tax=Spirodela intermedia TaxID=51605 RepID=A0A7I8IY51_SPIIN|nr:unnamed protein product [Spirodela intermedia]CAA6661931.1 unnamed protein product [Spirodela intermedia]